MIVGLDIWINEDINRYVMWRLLEKYQLMEFPAGLVKF